MCTNITLYQEDSRHLSFQSRSMNEINEFEKIIKEMRNENKRRVYVYSETEII
jgi:hypothetical protein